MTTPNQKRLPQRLTEPEFTALADAAELTDRDRAIVASVLVDGRDTALVASAYGLNRTYIINRVAAFVTRARLDFSTDCAPLILDAVPLALRDDIQARVAAYVAQCVASGSVPPRQLSAPLDPTAPWRYMPPSFGRQAQPKPVKPPKPQSARAQKAAMQRAIADARNGSTVQPVATVPDAFADWDEAD